jgi:hypothetical protein
MNSALRNLASAMNPCRQLPDKLFASSLRDWSSYR